MRRASTGVPRDDRRKASPGRDHGRSRRHRPGDRGARAAVPGGARRVPQLPHRRRAGAGAGADGVRAEREAEPHRRAGSAGRPATASSTCCNMECADPAVLRMGEVQALGGQAAYAAIRASIDLAMAGRIDGIATTPINKESLQAAKIPFIGHTEMFAEHTGAREEMTMFTISGLKIFFLTRHVSLIEACRADHPGPRREGHRQEREGAAPVGHRPAASGGRRAEPAWRRGRLVRPRGDRGDQAGDRRGARAGHAGQRAGAGGQRVPHGAHRPLRRRAVAVPRPGAHRGEDDGFREDRERDAGSADPAHLAWITARRSTSPAPARRARSA